MTIITTGVTGSLVARQEIRTMLLDKELFTLYILAMDRFQKVDQKELLSYFQIAGIHGR
jgi:tyrosinase